jgi:hypothetical protein
MLSGVGLQFTYGTNDAASNPKARATNDQSGALSGEILRDQVQLNDWLTCVSANTPKGKAEIQSLTARINAAKQHITKLDAEKAATREPSRQGSLVDTWA